MYIPAMLLAVDIGNTNIVVGLYDRDTLQNNIRLSTRGQLTSDEAAFLLNRFLKDTATGIPKIEKIVIASVVPSLTGPF